MARAFGDAPELRDGGRGRVERGFAGDGGFQRGAGAHRVGRADVADEHVEAARVLAFLGEGEEGALADVAPEDAFLHQHLERLAERGAAEAEFGAKAAFGREPVAGGEAAFDDEGAELRDGGGVRHLMERGACVLGRVPQMFVHERVSDPMAESNLRRNPDQWRLIWSRPCVTTCGRQRGVCPR